MAVSAPPRLYQGVIGEFSLQELENFPYTVYFENRERYNELEKWYTGESLEPLKKGKGNEGESFPVRINPVRSAAQKHATALFGEFSDGGDAPPVQFRVKSAKPGKRERANEIENILKDVFSESNAGPAMIENGLLSQIYGGCIFKLSWDPDNESLETGIRVDSIHPTYFVGVPNGSNYWDLKEAWIVQQITNETALSYGIEIPAPYCWYLEYWTPETYSIQINNMPVPYKTKDGENVLAGGDNPFGFVPFVYIPHIRTNSFYGESIVNDAVKGLVKELNKNVADAGDAVKAASSIFAVLSGARGAPRVYELMDGLVVIDIGQGNPNFSGGESKPKLEALQLGQISAPMIELVHKTQAMLNRELYTPDVAYGEFGGGSQRSSSSLYTMMWHLTAHVKLERVWWTSGLKVMAKMALKILKQMGKENISDEDLKLPISIQWAEYLPRDRAELIDELSVRAANKLGSLRHLLELTGDIDDAESMVEEIQKETKEMTEITRPPTPANQPGQANNQPGQPATKDAKQTAPSSRMPKEKTKEAPK